MSIRLSFTTYGNESLIIYSTEINPFLACGFHLFQAFVHLNLCIRISRFFTIFAVCAKKNTLTTELDSLLCCCVISFFGNITSKSVFDHSDLEVL